MVAAVTPRRDLGDRGSFVALVHHVGEEARTRRFAPVAATTVPRGDCVVKHRGHASDQTDRGARARCVPMGSVTGGTGVEMWLAC